MPPATWFWLLFLMLVSLAPGVSAEQTLLKFARMIDGTGYELPHRELLLADGVIVAVGDDLHLAYPAATRTELADLVAIPGMIDVHVHLTYGLQAVSKGDAWAELFASSASERLVAATVNAGKTLASGVTTVRDLSAFDGVDFQLKALVEAGVIKGPRIFSSGLGFHPLALPPVEAGQQRDLVAVFSTLAAERVEAGADWIKIFATTGSADDLSGEQIFHYPEIKAATDIAHAAGLRVALHAYGPSAVADALRAEVDSIEHPVGVGEETLKHWANTDIFYIPTIDHNRYYADHRDEYGYDENVVSDLRRFVSRNVESLRRARAAGVQVAFGSDAVMTMFGQNTRELEWFVEAGMTPAQALHAATMSGAELLGQAQFLGRLKAGYAADIVAVQGDPLTDVQAITRGVKWVMKDGDVVHATD